MGLNEFITTSDRTAPLSGVILESELQSIWNSVSTNPMPGHIIIRKDTFKLMKKIMREWESRRNGVVIRGCKGKRVVRFRKDRWEVR
jgi:hypothetical protein